MSKLIKYLFLLIILSQLHFLYSQPSIDGKWHGSILLSGSDLEIFVTFKTDPDSLRGTIDIPVQGAKDLKLTDCYYSTDKVHFELQAFSLAVFDGYFSNDSIAGDFTQSIYTGTFYLVRGEKKLEQPKDTIALPYKEEEVTYYNGDIKFAGTLTIPKTSGKHPAVVMITGSGAQNRDEEIYGFKIFRIIADALTRNGIAVLRTDDRGIGGSTGKSGSETTEDFAGDVNKAVKFLKTRDDIDPNQIGLFGHSEGGIIAPMVASQSGDISFIILMAGTGVKGIDILKEQSRLIILAGGGTEKEAEENNSILEKAYKCVLSDTGWDELQILVENSIKNNYDKMTDEEKKSIKDLDEYSKSMAKMSVQQMKSTWMKYFMVYDPEPALEKVKCPVLMLFGENDLQVPPKQNKEPMENALKKGGNNDYKTVIIPKANHLFQECDNGNPADYQKLKKEFAPGFLDAITGWILNRVTFGK